MNCVWEQKLYACNINCLQNKFNMMEKYICLLEITDDNNAN